MTAIPPGEFYDCEDAETLSHATPEAVADRPHGGEFHPHTFGGRWPYGKPGGAMCDACGEWVPFTNAPMAPCRGRTGEAAPGIATVPKRCAGCGDSLDVPEEQNDHARRTGEAEYSQCGPLYPEAR